MRLCDNAYIRDIRDIKQTSDIRDIKQTADIRHQTLRMNGEADYDYLFKIVFLGDSGVGKSCLLSRLTEQRFNENFSSTIGVDLKIKTVEMAGKIIKLQLWDTAGQERFRSITPGYYRGAHGILLCFDLTLRESFNSIQRWSDDVVRSGAKGLNWLMVGCKADLATSRTVSYDEASSLAASLGIDYTEVSAKASYKVEEALEKLIGDTLKTYVERSMQPTTEVHKTSGFKVLREGVKISQKNTCC